MDGQNQQRYLNASEMAQISLDQCQTTPIGSAASSASLAGGATPTEVAEADAANAAPIDPNSSLNGHKHLSTAECVEVSDILSRIKGEQLLVVNSRRRNGLILYKGYHAEFAGPGAVVGGLFDKDCHHVISVGDLSLVPPESHEERQKAYLIRRQWIRLTQQFTDQSVPLQRAQMILNQFENYFDAGTIARIPDEAFALLVGVLPHTVRQARRPPGPLQVKVKA
jgi:hypothetical protein